MYKIKNEQFEGPLDLLLSLIEKEQLDITQISLSKITGEYLNIIADLPGNSADLADFLVIAAKLLYIKSRTLIPGVATKEEEAEIEDLESKLREYSQFKAAAKHLESVLSENTRSFTRRAAAENPISFTPPANIDEAGLFAIFQDILKKIVEEKPQNAELKQKPEVTLEERRDYIVKHLKKTGKVGFRKILGSAKTKIDIIITFLAILEMVKQKEVRVEQTGNFADFTIMSTSSLSSPASQ